MVHFMQEFLPNISFIFAMFHFGYAKKSSYYKLLLAAGGRYQSFADIEIR